MRIEIGARSPGTPLTTPSMRVRTRRFVSLVQAFLRLSPLLQITSSDSSPKRFLYVTWWGLARRYPGAIARPGAYAARNLLKRLAKVRLHVNVYGI